MRFANSEYLILLLVSVGILALVWWGVSRRKLALARFGDLALVLRDRAEISFARQGGKGALVALATVFIVLSLSRFQCGTHLEMLKREGIDLIVAVDVSRSMLAEDLKPNRLSKASQEVRGIIDSLKGDRIGLVAFAGEAFVQCPLTLDYAAATVFLDAFNTDLIPQQGTAIGEAIRVATNAFEKAERRHKALILLTDGEDHGTQPIEAARKAREAGVRIYSIGIGSPQGEPIPVFDENGNRKGFLKDENGQIVVTRLDEATLREIALETGGKYYRASPGEMELERIMAEIAGLEKKELEGKLLTQYEDRFQWPLMIGIMILIMEFLMSERTGGKRRRRISEVTI